MLVDGLAGDLEALGGQPAYIAGMLFDVLQNKSPDLLASNSHPCHFCRPPRSVIIVNFILFFVNFFAYIVNFISNDWKYIVNHGKANSMNYLDISKHIQVIATPVEGVSVNAACSMTGVFK